MATIDNSEIGPASSKEDAEPRYCVATARVVWFCGCECLTPLRPTPVEDYMICDLMTLNPGFCVEQSRPSSAHEALEDRLKSDPSEPNP